MTLPFDTSTVACVSFYPVVDHPHYMHDHPNTARQKKISRGVNAVDEMSKAIGKLLRTTFEKHEQLNRATDVVRCLERRV